MLWNTFAWNTLKYITTLNKNLLSSVLGLQFSLPEHSACRAEALYLKKWALIQMIFFYYSKFCPGYPGKKKPCICCGIHWDMSRIFFFNLMIVKPFKPQVSFGDAQYEIWKQSFRLLFSCWFSHFYQPWLLRKCKKNLHERQVGLIPHFSRFCAQFFTYQVLDSIQNNFCLSKKFAHKCLSFLLRIMLL